jgi:hypothetical protein
VKTLTISLPLFEETENGFILTVMRWRVVWVVSVSFFIFFKHTASYTLNRHHNITSRYQHGRMQNTGVSNVRSMESDHKPLVILRCKCVVVGDACVGKTALTQVFNSGGSTYPKNYIMVISICVSQI